MSTPAPEKKLGRIKQYTQTYKIAKKTDRFLGLWTLVAFFGGAAAGALLFWLLPPRDTNPFKLAMIILGAITTGAMLALIIFSRRAQAAAFEQMDGKPGAALATLGMLKKGWKTDQMVAFTKQQDLVHRLIGRPGIVLIGEGNPQRLRALLTSERRKHERVASETAVYELIVGHGEGEVELSKLTSTVMKLPKTVKPAEMTDIINRLKALDAARPTIPLPKGPLPTSMKGMRGNLRGR